MNTKQIGDYGEELAVKHLKKCGYKILHRNYKCKTSEIDIIGYDGECLCFIEVKTRSRKDYGLACQAVDYRKQRKLVQGARLYIAVNKINSPVRFDVAEVYIDKGIFGGRTEINIIKNAFVL